MKSSSLLGLLKSVVTNHYVSSLLIFAVWLGGLLSGSVPVILLGLAVYLRPLLYVRLLRSVSVPTVGKKATSAGSVPSLAFSA